MDSLLANYASSDDEAGEAPTAPAPAPAPVSATARGGEAGAKPTAFSSGGGGAGIFSSLPQPKSAPLFSSLPAPKSGPTFSAIPQPKSSANPNKRVVQYRPQPIRQPTGDSSDDEEEDAKKRRASAAEARPAVSAGSGPVSSFLPPPKHSLGLGAGAGAGARRSAIDTAAPERPSLGGAAEPSGSVANTGAPERADAGAADDDDDDDSEDSASEDDMPAPDQQEDDGQLGSDPGAGQQQRGGYDAGAGSTGGYEAYAWDPNYYAQYGANYGWDPNGNANYVTGEQYAAYGGEQGSGYAHPPGGEHVGAYTNVAAAPYGVDYTERYDHEAATTFPPVQDPVLPPMMGRIGGKRGRNDMPAEIVEVNQAELMKNRPKQDTSKLTGLAFGPSYQPAPSAKGKPSKLHKRKHQIGSLYYDMKSKEMELAERRSKGILTKAETQAKYGW